jgi:hypothetical protein
MHKPQAAATASLALSIHNGTLDFLSAWFARKLVFEIFERTINALVINLQIEYVASIRQIHRLVAGEA